MYEKEKTILNNMYDLFEASSYVLGQDGQIRLKKCGSFGMNVIEYHEELRQKILKSCPMQNDACIFYDEPPFFFLACRVDDLVFLFGPICENAPDEAEKEAYRKVRQMEKRKYSIPIVSEKRGRKAVDLIRMIYGVSSNEWKRIEHEKTRDYDHEIVHYKYRKFQSDYQHLPFSVQKAWMDGIRNGDLEALFKIANTTDPDNIGLLAETDLKQAEYRAIVAIVISNLAAIEGGVDSEQAYELSDVFFHRLAKCQTPEKYDEVIRDVTLAYVKLVKKRKNAATNYHVSRCKDYIASHIQDNIKVSMLADRAGLDESYLGRLFKESEGITIKEYIHREKMKVASDMLIHSDTPISEISDFLGFHSKSYFGEIFLRTYQMTPLNYRMKNKAR